MKRTAPIASPRLTAAPLLLVALLTGFAPAPAGSEARSACVAVDAGPPSYYAIDLVTTRRVPGARTAEGTALVQFAPSPFGVSVTPDGSYAYDLHVHVDRIKPATNGEYVVWLSRPDLKEVERMGVLDETFSLEGRVRWNKFLVVISLEEGPADGAARWQGPIVLRGMSRSGRMHTMAGHGPFQAEPCATFGY